MTDRSKELIDVQRGGDKGVGGLNGDGSTHKYLKTILLGMFLCKGYDEDYFMDQQSERGF